MTYSLSHFTTGNKWQTGNITYTLVDFSRADGAISAHNLAHPDNKYTYNSSYGVDGFKSWSEEKGVSIHTALAKMVEIVPLTVQHIENPSDINAVNITISLVQGLYNSEGKEIGGVTFADPSSGKATIIYNINGLTNDGIQGSPAFGLLLHEIGHALGLFTLPPNVHPDEIAPLEGYTLDNTLMSYTDGQKVQVEGPFSVRGPATPMLYDVRALQELYGANRTTETGYGGAGDMHMLGGGNKAWTLWDGGGEGDVLKVGEGETRNAVLDLRGGVDEDGNVRWSHVGDEYVAIALDLNTDATTENNGVVDIEEAWGGAGDDTLIAGYSDHTLIGGEGEDKLYAGKGHNELYGGTENDYLQGGGGLPDLLYGGGGKDIFGLAHNSFVMDADYDDRIAWAGQKVDGGTQLWWMEGGWAYHTPTQSIVEAGGPAFYDALTVASAALDLRTSTFFRFGLSEGGQMIIQYARGKGGQAVIENYDLDLGTGAATGGVVAFRIQHVEDYRVTKEEYKELVNLAWKTAFGNGITGNDPILIDLDGDGIELTRERNSDVHFDFDADGFAEHTAWVKPDDGILVRDLNSNGSIDDSFIVRDLPLLRVAANDNSPQMRIVKKKTTHG